MRFIPEKKPNGGWATVALAAALLVGCAVPKPRADEPHDKGWVDRGILETPLYASFKDGYENAKIAPEFVAMVRQAADSVEVTIFFGGWCSDSKRELPRFLKLVDEAGIPSSRIRLYALDRTKKSDDGLTDEFDVDKVPTFIFLKNGKEVGRITESPQTTLEADVLTILVQAGKN